MVELFQNRIALFHTPNPRQRRATPLLKYHFGRVKRLAAKLRRSCHNLNLREHGRSCRDAPHGREASLPSPLSCFDSIWRCVGVGSSTGLFYIAPRIRESSNLSLTDEPSAHTGARSFFFTLVTGPRRSLSLKLSHTRFYEPQIRAHLGTTAHPGPIPPRLQNAGGAAGCKVDVRLPGEVNSNSHSARPVHLITMIKWIRTSRLSIKNSLSAREHQASASTMHPKKTAPQLLKLSGKLAGVRSVRWAGRCGWLARSNRSRPS